MGARRIGRRAQEGFEREMTRGNISGYSVYFCKDYNDGGVIPEGVWAGNPKTLSAVIAQIIIEMADRLGCQPSEIIHSAATAIHAVEAERLKDSMEEGENGQAKGEGVS